MTLDVAGLKPLDTTGLKEDDQAGDLNVTGLKLLDVEGLTEVEPEIGITDYPGEIGKGIVAGGLNMLGSVAKGAGGGVNALRENLLGSVSEQRAELAARGEDTTHFDKSLEGLQNLTKGGIEATGGYQVGEATQEFARETFPAGPGFEDSTTRVVSEGLGSTVPFLAMAPLGAPASLVAGTTMGSFASSGEAIDRAIDAGATREEINQAAKLGFLPGLTEQVPIEILLDRIPLPVMGRFVGALGDVLQKAAIEGGQEAVQQTAQNIISNYVYNPEQELSEGVLDSFIVGAAVGGILATGVETGKATGLLNTDGLQPVEPSPDEAESADLILPEFEETARQPQARPIGQIAQNTSDIIDSVAQLRGVNPDYLKMVAWIESRGNPNAQNPNSSAGGLFQFVDSTAKEYGLTNKYDPTANTDAAARLTLDNAAVLRRRLGREPSFGELYLAHQQGSGGASALLTRANEPAINVVGYDAVILNGGHPQMTAGQFANLWISKLDDDVAAPNVGPAVDFGAPPLPRTGQPAADSLLTEIEPGANTTGPVLQSLLDDERGIDEIRADAQRPEAGSSANRPITISTGSDIAQAGQNVDQNPTEAQKEAGNYKKGHIRLNGLDITVENPLGSVRAGVDPNGEQWQVTMPADYGYIKRTNGADGDHVDVYLGPIAEPETVFVADQIDPDSLEFDEHKVLYGFQSIEDAQNTYIAGFSDGRGAERLGALTPVPRQQFKDWVAGKATKKPFAYTKPRIKGRKSTRGRPASLIEYLSDIGGLRDFQGELQNIGAQDTFVPGAGKLVRQNGVTLDMAREAAAQEGYFGDNPDIVSTTTVADLLDLIDREIRGEQIFTADGQTEMAAREEKRIGEEVEKVKKQLTNDLKDAGYPDFTSQEVNEIQKLMYPYDGHDRLEMDMDEAVAEYIDQTALAWESEIADNAELEGQTDETIQTDYPGFEADPSQGAQEAGQQSEDVTGAQEEAAPVLDSNGSQRETDAEPDPELIAEQLAIDAAEEIGIAEADQTSEIEGSPDIDVERIAEQNAIAAAEDIGIAEGRTENSDFVEPDRDRETDAEPDPDPEPTNKTVGDPYLANNDGDLVKKTVRSKEWKQVFGSTTNINSNTKHYAHPESPVAYTRVQGWLDAKKGIDPDQTDRIYLEGYMGGMFGEALNLRDEDVPDVLARIIRATSSPEERGEQETDAPKNAVNKLLQRGAKQGRSASDQLVKDNFRQPINSYASKIFRQMDVDDATHYASGGGVMQAGPMGPMQSFWTDDVDLALGQGDNNSGPIAIADTTNSDIQGQINRSKPSWEMMFPQSAEFIVKNGMSGDAIIGFIVPTSLTNKPFKSALEKRFEKVGSSQYGDVYALKEEQESSSGDAGQITTETGADGREQAVVPGAEQIGDGELAQRRSDQPLKPKAEQKPADEGLFGDTAQQGDLLDTAAKPEPEKDEKPTDKIDDFGEVLIGARKHYAAEMSQKLGEEDVDIAAEPLSKTFPQPNYKKLAEDGLHKEALATVAILRDAIPNKPRRRHKLKQWITDVSKSRFAASLILRDKWNPDVVAEYFSTKSVAEEILLTARAIADTDPDKLKDAAKWRVRSGSFSAFGGQRFKPSKTIYYLQDDKGRGYYSDRGSDTDPERAVEKAKTIIAAAKSDDKKSSSGKRYTKMNVYRDRKTKEVYIGFKGLKQVLRLKGGFKSPADARSYLEENRDELQDVVNEMRVRVPERNLTNRPRKGPDRRDGNVDPDQFESAFKFRGVQFGNYVEGQRRQDDLNVAYDALIDMVETLSLPPAAVSLNGSLGLAFGARGTGGKNAAAAHFEPGNVVINLTKNAGPGALAHEWMHGLDNYFSRKINSKTGYISEARTNREGVRPEMFEAWKKLEFSLRHGPFAKRSEKLDEASSKPYFSTMREKIARSFEKYVVDRLDTSDMTNDYLANIDQSGGAYPTADEMNGGIREAYDGLFATLEHKSDEQGNVELFSLSDDSNRLVDDSLEAELRTELDRIGLGKVGLKIVDSIKAVSSGKAGLADGSYWNGLIKIATSSPDKIATLHHEALHALRGAGAFTENEWRSLSRKAKQTWMEKFKIAEKYSSLPSNLQIEEAIAAAYQEWVNNKLKAPGLIGKTFRKIKSLLTGLNAAFRNVGYVSVDQVFEDVFNGRIGGRLDHNAFVSPDSNQFSMMEYPETQAEKAQAMQGFFARGQFLDRALRIPFSFMGGLNKRGQWKPGLMMSEKASSIITEAKFSEESRFSFMNGPIEAARRGLIDRYGLDPEYIKAERKRGLSERAIMMEGAEVIKSLQEQNVGAREAKVLQSILTGEAVGESDMAELAEPIRKAIDDLGAEAVSLGLVSADSFERNRGSYLHRVYQKHEVEQNALSRWVSNAMGKRRKQIIGDQLKGRGMFVDIDVTRLMRDNETFKAGLEGAPQVGDKFLVLDRVEQQEAQPDGDVKETVTNRVYWPADRAIPDRLKEFRNQGTWEVRQKRGKGKLVLWRDYNKAEREQMGEILDARYTIGKTYMMMAHDLATGRFYKEISENEQWSTGSEPGTAWVDGAEAQRFSRAFYDPDVQWVKVPDTNIANTGGKKKFGALAGRWVRAEIWRDLNELDTINRPGFWRTLLTQWKLNKTARSPVTHMNNVMSNLVFMDMADVRGQDLVAGIRSYMTGDNIFQEAFEAGAFGSDLISQEIRDNVLKPLLEEITKEETGARNPMFANAAILGQFADKLWTWAKAADQKMLDAYRAEDEVFRMAMYIRRRQMGDSIQDAADAARQQFLDYDIRAPWVNVARSTFLPFIAYTYRAVPVIADAISTRPWKIAKYAAIAYAVNALSYMWDDEGDEEQERASLRGEEQGYTWIGSPRMIRMPYRSEDGLPVFLDVRRWIPAGDIFDMNQGQGALPVPAPLQFGGPLMLGAELALNKQAFTGKPIVNDLTDTWWEKGEKIGDWAWKSWMPSAAWIPGSWYYEKIGRAMSGATDYSGRPYDLQSAALSSVGIKLKPQDVEAGIYWKRFEFVKVERELKSQMRRAGRDLSRGLITQDEYDRRRNSLFEKYNNLNAKRKELQAATRPR